MNEQRRTIRRAFSLPEVLAALVLIGVVLPVAMRGVTLSMQTALQARHELEAAQLAQQKLAELLVLRNAGLFNDNGDFGQDWPQYRWQSTAAYADLGVYHVTVRVTWLQRNQERFVETSTLIFPYRGTDEEDDADDTVEDVT